jgi:SAM-dependent methyltransferase
MKIFLSYSHSDKGAAAWLVQRLRSAGYSVWSDADMDIGASIPHEVFERIYASDCIILLWSAAADQSAWVRGELNSAVVHRYAGKADLLLLPVRLDGSPLPPVLDQYRTINLDPDREAAVSAILRALAAHSKDRAGEGAAATPRGDGETPEGADTPGPHAPTMPALTYRNLFRLASLALPYVPLIENWHPDFEGYRFGEVDVEVDDSVYELPASFPELPPDRYFGDDPKCRLVSFQHQIGGREKPARLIFRFSKIRYSDYVRSGEHLDDPVPGDPAGQTFREVYAPRIGRERNLGTSPLPNTTGVGVFLITRDEKIIVARHSPDLLVHPDALSYSASGTMDWSDIPNPFVEVARECLEEIGHRVRIDDLRLFALGIDATRLYYQFSFVEETGRSADDIIASGPSGSDYDKEVYELIALPFDVEAVVESIGSEPWEPAAAATLLMLCARKFGISQVERAIDDEFVTQRWREVMLAEWRQRARRPGDQAVMSARYPLHRCTTESKQYIDAVYRFLGDDVDDRDIMEIGCGNGRLTQRLVGRARRLTALDLSEDMIEANRERLGPRAALVNYICGFAQEYRPATRHNVVICSLVLIHNVDDRPFQELVNVMKASADIIFLFEDVSPVQQPRPATRLRSEQELLDAFHDYRVERKDYYSLFADRVLFLKLVRE